MKYTIVVLATLIILYACSTVPLTGRKQLNLVSNAEIIPMASQEYDSVIRKGPLSRDAQQTDMVKRVGVRIQHAVEEYMAQQNLSSELAGFDWKFNLIDDPKTVNAWCMPGGKVAFYTGILPICKDETGVAIVMGHEVSHAIANHGRERMSQGMLEQLGMNTLSALMGSNPTAGKQLLFQAVGAGTQLGMLKFSRQDESEADHLGLIFMSLAGYDPNQAPIFWQRMADQSGGQSPPEFLSTHPSDQTRIKALQQWVPEAMKYYKKQ
ncbi:MAG TPA: M48 family metallopeptidase [Cyclobacteriaceae bacterium]|nr:M48 family metallopeptidase [Cyclobacteriaceae bacterium]